MVIKLRLENRGQVIDISNKLPKGFLKETGSRGFGIAPTTLTIREGASEGGRWRSTKRGPRNITLPLIFQADNEMAVRDLMRQFVAVINDKDGPPTMYATYPDGSEVYSRVHYASGGDHQYGADTDGTHWCRWPLTFRAPSPYWNDINSLNYSMSVGNVGRGLIKDGSLSKLMLSSSSAIGSITVENPGDVDAYPQWQVLGPGDFFQAYINGVGFKYNAEIPATEQVFIDTEAKTVTDQNGVNRYAELDPAPKLFSIPPGQSSIDIAMDGADANSRILFNFQPRYEVVF